MPGWKLARSEPTIAIRWREDLDHCDATFGEWHIGAALDEPVRLLLTGDEDTTPTSVTDCVSDSEHGEYLAHEQR